MSVVSYLQLNHPALGTAGGASLHASVEALYTKIGDNLADRLITITGLTNGATQTIEHNFNTPFTALRYDIFLWNSGTTELTPVTRTSTPARSDFTVVASSGDLTGSMDVTNNSGSTQTLAIVIFRDAIRLEEDDVKDVTTSGVTDGQILGYDTATGKWKPFSGVPVYVGTDPEVGGSTPFQLTGAHKRVQVINPAGAITVKLPTTGILAGEHVRVVNRSLFDVTVQSSGANALGVANNAALEFVALQNTPTSAAHWADYRRVQDQATLYVGQGPGAFATLALAIAAAVAGNTIVVTKSTTEAAGDVSVNVADLKIRCQPGAVVAMSGAMTNGLRLTAARVRLIDFAMSLAPSGTQARGLSIEAADCWVEGRIDYNASGVTLTDAVHITSAGVRQFARVGVNKVAGTITNLLTNNDGAGDPNVFGG